MDVLPPTCSIYLCSMPILPLCVPLSSSILTHLFLHRRSPLSLSPFYFLPHQSGVPNIRAALQVQDSTYVVHLPSSPLFTSPFPVGWMDGAAVSTVLYYTSTIHGAREPSFLLVVLTGTLTNLERSSPLEECRWRVLRGMFDGLMVTLQTRFIFPGFILVVCGLSIYTDKVLAMLCWTLGSFLFFCLWRKIRDLMRLR